MNQKDVEALLTQHDVKPTANRIVVARALAEAGRPLTLTELEYKILSIDKSSVFRVLTLFREHHLVHAIEDGGNGLRYELCHSHSQDEDDDLHVHFYCECCQRTICLERTPVPPVPVPGGFQVTSANYILKGICPECARNRTREHL